MTVFWARCPCSKNHGWEHGHVLASTYRQTSIIPFLEKCTPGSMGMLDTCLVQAIFAPFKNHNWYFKELGSPPRMNEKNKSHKHASQISAVAKQSSTHQKPKADEKTPKWNTGCLPWRACLMLLDWCTCFGPHGGFQSWIFSWIPS